MFAPLARAPRRARAFARFHHAGARFAASAWRHWFLDRHAEFWLGQLGSAWSASELRARVVEIIDETADTRTFVLAPNRHWPGHRAGQYVAIAVEIDGVRVRRSYSISSGASAPGDRIAITVKRVDGGRVSTWLHDRLRPGHVIGLGRPKGDFVVPYTATPHPELAPRIREICARYGQVYNTGSFAKQLGSVARQLVVNALPVPRAANQNALQARRQEAHQAPRLSSVDSRV